MYDEILEVFIILPGVWASNLGRESVSRAGGCVAGASGLGAQGVFGPAYVRVKRVGGV